MDEITRARNEARKVMRFLSGLALIVLGAFLSSRDSAGSSALISFGAIISGGAGVCFCAFSLTRIEFSRFRKRVRRGIW